MHMAPLEIMDAPNESILHGFGVVTHLSNDRLSSQLKRTTQSAGEGILQGRNKSRSGETMERWRNYFGKAGADLWTIIEQAIILAAIDYPKDFKEKRSEIAEMLFARSLLQVHAGGNDVTRLSGSVVTNITNVMAENGEATRGARSEGERLHCSYEEAEALTDEMEEETLRLKEINSIKETLADSDQSESIILNSLQRLEYMQITVEALKATEIGKQVNGLRKHSSKVVRAIVKRLVRNWKVLVDEWVKSAEDVTTAAIEGSKGCELGSEEQGLPSPPLDEGELLAARTTSLEMSQLLSFIDDEICGHKGDEIFHSDIIDNLYYPSKTRSGSLVTDCSDYDAKAITSHDWGFRVPEERGSTTRDFHSGWVERKVESTSDFEQSNHLCGLSVSKSVTGGSGPGRPSIDNTSKARATSGPVSERCTNDFSKIDRSHELQRTAGSDSRSGDKSLKPSTLNKLSVDKNQVAQKLELAKRKLHEGYQQAENAKKQRTVQLVDLPDLPKVAQMCGKFNPQSKAVSQTGQWSQSRRYG